MSNIRRAIGTALAAGFLGGLALVPPAGFAQDGKKQPVDVAKQPPLRKAVAGVIVAPTDNNDKPRFADSITFPTDRKAQRKIEGAEDLLKEQHWGEAAGILQSLLDAPEDIFIEVKRNDVTHWTSMKGEANRLIGSMPPQGRQFYELQFGARARGRLAEARSKSDPQILAEVAHRYQHTEAGADAALLLGTYHLDRGRYLMAALFFERLLERETQPDSKVSHLTLVKATLAFRHAGDRVKADQAWKRLAKAARDGVRIGDQTLPLDEVQKELDRIGGETALAGQFDWPLFKGNAPRNASGNGSAPFLDMKWTYSTVTEKQTEPWLDQAIKTQENRGQPVLPAFFPIAATVQTPDKVTLPLLVYRSHWGVHARNLAKDGKLTWDSPSNGSLDRMAADPDKLLQLNQWLQLYQNTNSNLLFENSVTGTLSTDNKRVYVIDDMVLPPHPQAPTMQQLLWGQPAMFGKLQDQVYHSRLQAFDLVSGKLKWELGGRGSEKGELSDSYFLGPPLPVGDKLYVLVDKNSELRMVCLDLPPDETQPPTIGWIQTLANVRDKLLLDVGRRMQAAHLSYSEGILVCPTNAGVILGVDLLSHSLVWAHSYREELPGSNAPDPKLMMMRPGMAVNGHPLGSRLDTDWKTSAPIIQDGRVVFTAPDAVSVHCVNLRNGDLLWKERRADDLYLAGVYNGKVLLVGKSTCRALNVTDGKQAWKVETGLPSGQGVASDNVYYLPLKVGAQSKEPEVCALDIDTGVILAHTKSRKKEVPGNLLFHEGDVVSQTATKVTAYQQLRIKLAEIDKALLKNPRDPVGLTERGELKLEKGDLAGAVEDLRLALANQPPAAELPRTRAKLFETLTELFQRDFNASEKYLDEYQEMCRVPIPAGAADEERQKLEDEHQRRQANFLCLLAKGREHQGRLAEAFQAYQDFGHLAGNRELVSVIDEPAIRARPDVWSQGRIAAMVARATPEQRKPLEERIAQRWRTVTASKDIDDLRQFVAVFGSLFSVGKEARLALAERLMEEDKDHAFLEAELHLLRLRNQEDASLAARAVEALARLMIKKGLLEDAAYWHRILGRDFATTAIRDGKTGADFLNDLATDKRLLACLDEPRSAWGQTRFKARENPGTFGAQQQQLAFEPEGELLPFFQRHRLILQNGFQLELIDRSTQEKRFSKNLNTPNRNLQTVNISQFLNSGGYPNVRLPYHLQGHLIVVSLGQIVYGIDPIARTVLWEKNLFGNNVPQPNFTPSQDKDGTLQINYPDGFFLKLGKTGPTEASYICLNTREGLIALDPLRGTVLWTRSDISPRTQFFGDEHHIYLVEVRPDGSMGAGRALRAHDGVSVNVPEFGPLYQRRLRVMGRRLLLSEPAAGGLAVRLYDVLTGKDVWKKTFTANAVVLRGEDPDLVGVVEPGNAGQVTVFNLHTQKVALQARVDVKDLEKIQEAHLLCDQDRFYLTLHRAFDQAANPWGGGPWPNVSNGIRCIPVNGVVYAFERSSGKLWWRLETVNQMLVLEQFKDIPVLLFTSRSQRAANNVVGGINRGSGIIQVVATKSFDKRTGKLLYDREHANQSNQFYALNVNARTGTIELVGYNIKITLFPDTETGPKVDKPGSAEPKGPAKMAPVPVPAPVSVQPVIK